MVVCGASLHVWHGISDSCVPADEDEELDEASAAFCTRTKLAMCIGVVGVVSGWLVNGSRLFGCPITEKYRTHVETYLSVFLMLVFSVGVALITGIGGPASQVGDLYYASWLSFFVSLAIFVSCIDQLQRQELDEAAGKVESNEVHGYITFLEDSDESTEGLKR